MIKQFLILFLCSLCTSLKFHVAHQAILECKNDQNNYLKYATIPAIKVSTSEGNSALIRNVVIDPKAGDLLMLSSHECEAIGINKFAGISFTHNVTMYDASATFMDASSRSIRVDGKVRVACRPDNEASNNESPRIGVFGLVQIMSLEVLGDEVYADLGKIRPNRVSISRSI